MIKTNRFRLLTTTKDGGPESHVWAYWLIAIKALFSIVLLRFEDGSREAYHEHAFNCVSWVLWGKLEEHLVDGTVRTYRASPIPVFTYRDTFHKVMSHGRTWVVSFRGPWVNEWREYLPETRETVTLTHGRRQIGGQGSIGV